MSSWYLEGVFDNAGVIKQQRLPYFPQTLGREENLDCTVSGLSVSRRHAQLDLVNGQLVIQDLGSRNGTCVNRIRITGPTPLQHGDVIHLGDSELRILDANHSQKAAPVQEAFDETAFINLHQLSQHFPSGISHLEQLLAQRQIRSVYQAIVRGRDMQVVGYELLSRSDHPDLPASPLELFKLAESFGLELELSELMRDEGIATAVTSGIRGQLLVNTHPKELQDVDRLLASLQAACTRFPSARLTLEIHEHAITNDMGLLKHLKKELARLQISLAFDDFGVGQSRLLEMVEAKPDLIKFDKLLIENIDSADASRLKLVTYLKDLARTLGIYILAECVSNEAEFRTCRDVGFDYYQGYYLGRPESVDNLATCIRSATG